MTRGRSRGRVPESSSATNLELSPSAQRVNDSRVKERASLKSRCHRLTAAYHSIDLLPGLSRKPLNWSCSLVVARMVKPADRMLTRNLVLLSGHLPCLIFPVAALWHFTKELKPPFACITCPHDQTTSSAKFSIPLCKLSVIFTRRFDFTIRHFGPMRGIFWISARVAIMRAAFIPHRKLLLRHGVLSFQRQARHFPRAHDKPVVDHSSLGTATVQRLSVPAMIATAGFRLIYGGGRPDHAWYLLVEVLRAVRSEYSCTTVYGISKTGMGILPALQLCAFTCDPLGCKSGVL
ncbi:hypothetical protein C8R46DRAFT_345183 [Mycena filopes]|nr:hypothetical protein C8R46DRAFT_345183 [Mycena filopes]